MRTLTCRVCKCEYPDTKLTCPACTERKSDAAILEVQRMYIPLVISGRKLLTLVYVPGNKSGRQYRWHLQRFEDDRHAYCSEKLPAGLRQDHVRHSILSTVKGLCPDCLSRLNQLVATTEPTHVSPDPVQTAFV